jgi:hypothetical protein
MKRILFTFLSAIAYFSVCAQSPTDLRNPVKEIHLEGYVQNRLQSSIQNRILAQDIDRLVEVFNPSY